MVSRKTLKKLKQKETIKRFMTFYEKRKVELIDYDLDLIIEEFQEQPEEPYSTHESLKCECRKYMYPIHYCEDHDCYYCPDCDVWLEAQCNDPECGYCATRPEKPSMADMG